LTVVWSLLAIVAIALFVTAILVHERRERRKNLADYNANERWLLQISDDQDWQAIPPSPQGRHRR
jgi:hypothetical protein